MTVRELITTIAKQQVPIQVKVAKVKSINTSTRTCDVTIEGHPERIAVRLQSIEGSSTGMVQTPTVGSFVLVGLIENDPTSSFICGATELDQLEVVIGNSTFSVKDKVIESKSGNFKVSVTDNKVEVSNSVESLNAILSDLISTIKLITVNTPQGVSGTPINAAAFTAIGQRLNNLLS